MTRENLRQWIFSRWAFGTVCCALAAITAGAQSQSGAKPPDKGAATASAQARENRDAPELAVFKQRVEDFAALHRKLEATLPNLPKESTPEQIDRHQRALATLIASSRPKAQPGDLFTPGGADLHPGPPPAALRQLEQASAARVDPGREPRPGETGGQRAVS